MEKDKNQQESPNRSESSEGGGLRIVAIALLAIGASFFLYVSLAGNGGSASTSRASVQASASNQSQTEASSSKASPPSNRDRKPAPYYISEEEARPFPVTLPPSNFRNKGVAKAYQIAKDIPGVLAQQPCLCGCERIDEQHGSLLDCYTTDHASG